MDQNKVVGGADYSREHSQKIRITAQKSIVDVPKHKLSKGTGKSPRVVVIACGSYSPITFMHLRMFEQAKDYGMSEKVNIIGGYLSPVSDAYKKQGLVSANHRIRMCELAVESSDFVCVDKWESDQPEYQTTIAVLDHFYFALNKDEPKDNPINVMLLCGADLLESFNKPGVWHADDIRDIVKNYGLLVIERTGVNVSDIVNSNPLLKELKDNIFVIPQLITNDVSSTKMRSNVANGLSIKYLTPDSVIKYIQENGLYIQQKL